MKSRQVQYFQKQGNLQGSLQVPGPCYSVGQGLTRAAAHAKCLHSWSMRVFYQSHCQMLVNIITSTSHKGIEVSDSESQIFSCVLTHRVSCETQRSPGREKFELPKLDPAGVTGLVNRSRRWPRRALQRYPMSHAERSQVHTFRQ